MLMYVEAYPMVFSLAPKSSSRSLFQISSTTVRMADMMKVPVRALVENMSSFKCPGCGGVHRIFGEGRAREIAAAHSIGAFASLPIDPALAAAVDAGGIENADTSALKSVLDAVL